MFLREIVRKRKTAKLINFCCNFDFKKVDSNAANLTPCPDQFVATYCANRQGDELKQISRENIQYGYNVFTNEICWNRKKNTIVIILESPHIKEYKKIGGQIYAEGPLCGKWKDFAIYFHAAIQNSSIKINLKKIYNVIFINAIQFQCSLGKPLWRNVNNKNIKDRNVLNSWSMGFEIDLIQRIKAIKPEIIINLCGKNHQISHLVDQTLRNNSFFSINKYIKRSKYALGCHPSSWRRLKIRNSNFRLID